MTVSSFGEMVLVKNNEENSSTLGQTELDLELCIEQHSVFIKVCWEMNVVHFELYKSQASCI